jgi:hypothetical protein
VLDDLIDIEAPGCLFDVWRDSPWCSELADGHVVGNAVQPRLDVPDIRTSVERPPCLEQRLLQRVLRVSGITRQPPAIGEQLVAISAHQRLERRLVALARKLCQAAVGLGLKEPQ